MSVFRKFTKYLIENLTGFKIERYGFRSFALIDRKTGRDVWFSYLTQVRSIFKDHEIDLVLDVGANEGRFARKIRSFYPGEILSFEPVSSTFEKLAAAASSDPKWHVHKLALGNQNSTQTINVYNSTEFNSLLTTNEFCDLRYGNRLQKIGEEVVTVCRLEEILDTIVQDIETKRIFIKLDTQGYDLEVFKGLGSKLDYIKALQSEVSLIPMYESMPHWTESITTYEKEGFSVVGMFPVIRDVGRIIEYDCLLTRVDF
jgi:FkbM family methyltransferase